MPVGVVGADLLVGAIGEHQHESEERKRDHDRGQDQRLRQRVGGRPGQQVEAGRDDRRRLAHDPPAGEDQQIDRVSEDGDAEHDADDVLRQDQVDADGEEQPDEQREHGFHQASSRSSSASAIEVIEPTTTK